MRSAGNLGRVKKLLALALIALLLLVGLPVVMDMMSHAADYPACVAGSSFGLGLCAGILSLLILAVLMPGWFLRNLRESFPGLLVGGSIYRPPRLA